MEREMRLQIYEKEIRRLLLELRDHDFAIFEDARDTERYVQYIVHDSAVHGEVGSRHPLPHDAHKLACMTELLFGAAYGEDVCHMTPLVRTRASREAEAPPVQMEFDA